MSRIFFNLLIVLWAVSLPCAAVGADPNVKEEQDKLKGAIEKAKKPVETFKDLAPSAGLMKPDAKPAAGTPDKAGQPAAQQAQQKTAQTETIDYIHLGRRDPFVPLVKVKEAEKKKGSSPMEDFMATDIKVVGILVKNAQYFAQIVLPDGKSYTIRPGQKLGLMGGIVSEINIDAVIIKEKGLDADGKPIIKNITLRLRKEDE